MACAVVPSFAKTGSPAASPRDCWDPLFKFPKRFPSSVPCFWSQVAFVASPPAVLASNHAIPGSCSQIIRRRVFERRKFSRLALILQVSRQFQCILRYITIVFFFVGNLQICWEIFNIDCRMFVSLHLVLCNMRASQLIFWDLAVQTLSASQAGRWEGCSRNCLFPHFVQILERAWIWVSESRHFVLCFPSLIYLRLQERPHAPNRCCQFHCPWPASLWNCTCTSLHGKVQTVFWVEQRRKPPV